jgi:hypothetical protein
MNGWDAEPRRASKPFGKPWKLVALPVKHLDRKIFWSPTVEQSRSRSWNKRIGPASCLVALLPVLGCTLHRGHTRLPHLSLATSPTPGLGFPQEGQEGLPISQKPSGTSCGHPHPKPRPHAPPHLPHPTLNPRVQPAPSTSSSVAPWSCRAACGYHAFRMERVWCFGTLLPPRPAPALPPRRPDLHAPIAGPPGAPHPT